MNAVTVAASAGLMAVRSSGVSSMAVDGVGGRGGGIAASLAEVRALVLYCGRDMAAAGVLREC
jgi:hypothetical protein